MTELPDRVWWPFCNIDLLNRFRLCKACTDFGKILKPVVPANKFKPLTPSVEPNQESQLVFARPISDSPNKKIHICIY